MAHRLRFTNSDVKIQQREPVFRGYFSVYRVTVRHRSFAGDWAEPVTREVFERGDAVGVLPYDPVNDAFVLVEQFRAGALGDAQSPWMLELVAGIVDAGQSDESVARREADEEAGCELGELYPIAAYYPSAGACTEHVRLFCGRVLDAAVGEVRGLDEEGEDILVHRLPRLEVLGMLARGEISNGHTLVALQWFALNQSLIAKAWLGREQLGREQPGREQPG
ncbi:MAG: ADP-ribose diphosphatase [Congregibacter sp.]